MRCEVVWSVDLRFTSLLVHAPDSMLLPDTLALQPCRNLLRVDNPRSLFLCWERPGFDPDLDWKSHTITQCKSLNCRRRVTKDQVRVKLVSGQALQTNVSRTRANKIESITRFFFVSLRYKYMSLSYFERLFPDSRLTEARS